MNCDKKNISGCIFLIIISYIVLILLTVLSFYITYRGIISFTKDGFAFMEAFMMFPAIVVLILSIALTWRTIQRARKKSHIKYLFIAFLGVIIILIGLILHNATNLWPLIILLGVLLLVSRFLCKKELGQIKNKTKFTILYLIIISTLSNKLLAKTSNTNNKVVNSSIEEVYLLDKNNFNPYLEYVSTDIKDFFNPKKSNPYPSSNLFDGYLKTCWVAGNLKEKKQSVNLFMKIPEKIDVGKIVFNIFGGYGKNLKLFHQNARPRKIKLSIYAAFYPHGCSTEVVNLYLIEKYAQDIVISLQDLFEVQSFPLKLNQAKLVKFQKGVEKKITKFNGKKYRKCVDLVKKISFTPSLILKVEILDSYQGTKYGDICISEIFFNNRVVTPYPDIYMPINSVYIKNNNKLFVEYFNKKRAMIYQNNSSVLTAVDWPKNSNWAVLHHTSKESVGRGSRVEELYSLVDLKNKKNINNQFKIYTGYELFSPIITKDKNGKTSLDTGLDYSIELK